MTKDRHYLEKSAEDRPDLGQIIEDRPDLGLRQTTDLICVKIQKKYCSQWPTAEKKKLDENLC